MKKIIVAVLLISNFSFCQVVYEKYVDQIDKKQYEIKLNQPNRRGVFTMDIYCESRDGLSKEVCLTIDSKKTNDFKEYLIFLRGKYIEYVKTAIENKVQDVSKKIKYKTEYYDSSFLYGSWHNSKYTVVDALFTIDKSVPLLMIYSNKLISYDNQFINSEGFFIPFTSLEDFDKFILYFDNEKMLTVLNESKTLKDLFKD